MRPNDIVQPTKLCMEVIHKFKPWHRATVLATPEKSRGKYSKAILVKWDHQNTNSLMAHRYVELVCNARRVP